MISQLFSNPRTKIILVIIGVLIFLNVVATIISALFPSLPPIISTNPSNNAAKTTLDQPFIVNFKQPIQVTDFSLTSEPTLSWDIAQTSSTTLTATHSLDFQPSTTYTLTLAWKNQAYSPIKITTMASQVDPLFIKQTNDELARDYPLAQLLPYNTDLYRVVYSAPMTLEITIKNENILPEKAFGEIRSWVTSVGGDADAHKYVISDKPLPSPAIVPTKAGSSAPTTKPSPTPFNWDTLQDDGT